MRDLIAGIALIAIGFFWGDSIFLGDFSLPAIFFDGLGLFFIIRGIVRIRRARQVATHDSQTPVR